MKTTLSFLTILFFSHLLVAQTTAIPDYNFEQALIDLGYDTGKPNGVIPTANINKITSLNVNRKNISDLTGIEDFVSLTSLECGVNYLNSLNISNNIMLTFLDCGGNYISILNVNKNTKLKTLNCPYNYLTNLNVSKNTALKELQCYYNSLNNLDVSKNTSLNLLQCNNNSLSTLDVSKNIFLDQLECHRNSISNLDLSHNTELFILRCDYNSLRYLDLRNRDYTKQFYLQTNGNPNLFCITVDAPSYSNTRWYTTKDSWTQYTNYICGKNKISGIAYYDKDKNCTQDSGEQRMPHVIIKIADTSKIYTITNDTGYYELWVDSNTTYKLSVLSFTNSNLLNASCPSSGYTINSGTDGADTTNINFGLDIKLCALPSVDISMDRLRRCFRNNAIITYRNNGTVDQANAEIFVDFPEYVKLVSASKSYTMVNTAEGIYKFNIGTIKAFSEGSINIVDSVVCGNQDIRGYTQCIKTWIIPKSYCVETKDTTKWDKSSIKVISNVECIGNSKARFTIINQGDGDMLTAHEYRLYYNNELAYSDSFQLKAGDSIKIEATADGSTIRLEADQHPFHPGKSKPRATIEGCESATPAKAALGFWQRVPNDDFDFDISEKCLEIRDSYDPNDKKISPSGITTKHYISKNEVLNYTIRFQNTGNDTAYKIKIIDTLSKQFDISSLHINGASHNFKYTVSGKEVAVLEFTFNNINLPDSTTNEAASHGYVSFSISLVDSITKGTSIKNFADIYFDFNSAIRTDTTAVIALDTIISNNKIITVTEISKPVGTAERDLMNISIFPNPSNDYIFIKGINYEFKQIRIYDVTGRLVITQLFSLDNPQKINISSLKEGCYFIHLEKENRESYVFKMVKK